MLKLFCYLFKTLLLRIKHCGNYFIGNELRYLLLLLFNPFCFLLVNNYFPWHLRKGESDWLLYKSKVDKTLRNLMDISKKLYTVAKLLVWNETTQVYFFEATMGETHWVTRWSAEKLVIIKTDLKQLSSKVKNFWVYYCYSKAWNRASKDAFPLYTIMTCCTQSRYIKARSHFFVVLILKDTMKANDISHCSLLKEIFSDKTQTLSELRSMTNLQIKLKILEASSEMSDP